MVEDDEREEGENRTNKEKSGTILRGANEAKFGTLFHVKKHEEEDVRVREIEKQTRPMHVVLHSD